MTGICPLAPKFQVTEASLILLMIKRSWKTVCWILFVCESETVVDREKEGCGGMVVVMAVMVDGVLRIGNFIN
jgi:hypothetical protein